MLVGDVFEVAKHYLLRGLCGGLVSSDCYDLSDIITIEPILT